jgi:tetratricopeptide (TPR) repeat protein
VRAANRQPEAARSAYNRALALAPALLPAQLNLARLDAAEGRVDAARRRLGDLLRKDAGKVQALTELGRLERAAGRLAEARPLLGRPTGWPPPTRPPAPSCWPSTSNSATHPRRSASPNSWPRPARTTRPARSPRPCPPRRRRAGPGLGRLAKLARQAGGDAERLVAVGALQLFAGDGGGAAASAEKALAARPSAGATLQVEAELAAGALERAEALQAAFARRTGNGAERAAWPETSRCAAASPAWRWPPIAPASSGRRRRPWLRAFAAAFKAGQGAEGVSLIEAWLRRQPDDLAARAALAEQPAPRPPARRPGRLRTAAGP